jgi:membrane protein implicated in regulation of membrane protease activity
VTFLIAVLLAWFFLPSPWNAIVVIGAAVLEVVEAGVFIWWSRRRRATVGAEALIGKVAVAVGELSPEGQVRVDGELWSAHCKGGAATGSRLVVRGIDGLVLEVAPE